MNNVKNVYADAIYSNKNIKISIAGDGTDYEDIFNYENLLDFLQSEISIVELIEDKIDIDDIEEFNISDEYTSAIINEDNIYTLFKTQNEIIKAVKQVNKEIKELKEN